MFAASWALGWWVVISPTWASRQFFDAICMIWIRICAEAVYWILHVKFCLLFDIFQSRFRCKSDHESINGIHRFRNIHLIIIVTSGIILRKMLYKLPSPFFTMPDPSSSDSTVTARAIEHARARTSNLVASPAVVMRCCTVTANCNTHRLDNMSDFRKLLVVQESISSLRWGNGSAINPQCRKKETEKWNLSTVVIFHHFRQCCVTGR